MRYLLNIIAVIFCIVSAISPVQAGAAEDAAQAILQADDASRAGAADKAIELGPKAIPALFEIMGGENHSADKAAVYAAEKIVYIAGRPGAETDRAAAEKALITIAQSEKPQEQRLFAIRLLSYVGKDAAVSALGALLKDKDMQEMARWALVRIPGQASVDALAGALGSASGRFKAGLIQALADHGGEGVLAAARAGLKDADKDVRYASYEALGRCGDESDAETIRSLFGQLQLVELARAVETYRSIADRLAADGKAKTAHDLFAQLLPEAFYENNSGSIPRAAEIQALVGIGKTGGRADLETLMSAIQSDSADYRTAAQRGLVYLKYDPSGAITRSLPDAQLATQRLMVQVLKERKGSSSAAALRKAVVVQEPIVKVDALTALAAYASVRDVPLFLKAMKEPAPVGDTARNLLVSMDGDKVTAKLLSLYKKASDVEKPELLRLLGDRRDSKTLPVIMSAIDSGNNELREIALNALSGTRDKALLPDLLTAIGSEDEGVRTAAQKALGNYRDMESKKAIVARLPQANDEALAVLLRIMAKQGDPKMGPTFAAYAKDKRPAVRAAALSGLYGAPDEAGLPIFREAADSKDEEVHKEGIRGMMVVAQKMGESDKGKALALLNETLSKARTSEIKGSVIREIGAIKTPEALAQIKGFLEDENLREAACLAAITQADLLRRDDRDTAVDLLRKAVNLSNNPETSNEAIRRLANFRDAVDLAEFGIVSHWWISGPFKGREALRELKETPAKGEVDLKSPWSVKGDSHEWKEITVRHPEGMVNLKDTMGEVEDAGAFLYTEFNCNKAGKGKILAGSDDDLTIWLNGEKISEENRNRAFKLGDDSVDVSLSQGTNKLVLKVLQGGGDWACGVRIVGEDGKGIPLK